MQVYDASVYRVIKVGVCCEKERRFKNTCKRSYESIKDKTRKYNQATTRYEPSTRNTPARAYLRHPSFSAVNRMAPDVFVAAGMLDLEPEDVPEVDLFVPAVVVRDAV